MSIWYKKDLSISDLQPLGVGTMAEHVGIEWVEVGENFLRASMPVDHRTRQPYGLLHGGASVTLAETIGSVAAAMVINHEEYLGVGLEINANHISSARSGKVTGTATPIHIGKRTQVWNIHIHDEKEKLVCISRITVAILERRDR